MSGLVLLYALAAAGYGALQLSELRRFGLEHDVTLWVGLIWLSVWWPISMPIDALLSWREER